MIFKPGDKVKCAFFGDEVCELESWSDKYVLLRRSNGQTYTFLEDGRYAPTHTYPVLTFVEAAPENPVLPPYIDEEINPHIQQAKRFNALNRYLEALEKRIKTLEEK